MKSFIKRLLRENLLGEHIDEGFLSTMIDNKMDKFKDSWNKFMIAAKREGNETYEAAKILGRLLNPKTINGVTGDEKKFLKAQSKLSLIHI